MYLQSIHLTRLVSRLITVKSLQSEWRTIELFSAECGAPLNSSRVASAELNVYPYIIPASHRIFSHKWGGDNLFCNKNSFEQNEEDDSLDDNNLKINKY